MNKLSYTLILTIKFDLFNFSRVDNMLKYGLNFKGSYGTRIPSLNFNCTKSSGFYMLQVIHSSVTPFVKLVMMCLGNNTLCSSVIMSVGLNLSFGCEKNRQWSNLL